MNGTGSKYSVRNDTFIYAVDGEGISQKVFGKGIAGLLNQIRVNNSINEACAQTGISYSKAMRMIKRAESVLSIELLERRKGGNDREGSRLSQAAAELLDLFNEIAEENRAFAVKNSERFLERLEQVKRM